jgi:hypothetical protein
LCSGLPSWQRFTEAGYSQPEIHRAIEGGRLQLHHWTESSDQEHFRAVRLRSNGTVRLLPKTTTSSKPVLRTDFPGML